MHQHSKEREVHRMQAQKTKTNYVSGQLFIRLKREYFRSSFQNIGTFILKLDPTIENLYYTGSYYRNGS